MGDHCQLLVRLDLVLWLANKLETTSCFLAIFFNKIFIGDFFSQKKGICDKVFFFDFFFFAKWGKFPPKKSLYKTFQMTYGQLMRNCHVDVGEVLLKKVHAMLEPSTITSVRIAQMRMVGLIDR
jgi:hypothetical protein